MYCINVSHPEYKNLLYNSKQNPLFVKAKISMWMDYNGDSRFPTVEELNSIDNEFYSIDKYVRLGKYFNMNTGGFMPSNIDLGQLQQKTIKLDIKYKRSPKTGQYYFLDEYGRFLNPFKQSYKQLESSSTELPQIELKEKLMAFAKTHGIQVTTMEELIARSENKGKYDGVVGVAQLFNELIAIDLSKEKIDTLAEEIAHFATAILKEDASVKKAMKDITDTEIYKQVKIDYADTYTTEEQFRKEAVDKLLAEAIVQDFKEEGENKGIVKYLKAIYNKFMRWVKSGLSTDTAAQQIKNELMPIAKSIIANEYLGKIDTAAFIDNSNEYLQKESETVDDISTKPPETVKKEFIKKTIAKLEDRLATLKRQAKKQAPIDALSLQVDAVTKKLELAKLDSAIEGIVELAIKELGAIESLLDKHLEDGVTVGSTIDMVYHFAEMYQTLFDEYKRDMHYHGFPKEEQDKIGEQLNITMKDINNVLTKNDTLAKRHILEVLEKGNLDHNGNKIDPDFNAIEIFNKSEKDISFWRLGAGNYKNATSGVLRVAHKMIYNANAATKRLAVEKANILIQAQVLMEKSGVKVEELVDYTERNGKKVYSQFLIRQWDWAGYYNGILAVKEEVAQTLGFEKFDDIEHSELTAEQKAIYKNGFTTFNKNNRVKVVDSEGRFTGYRPTAINPRFAQLMNNPHVKNYHTLLVNTKEEALNKLPIQYRTAHAPYQLPGIRQQFIERMTNGENSFFHNLAEIGRESFFIDQDDTQFGEVSALNNKMVPIYFTRPFDNPAEVSKDLSRSFTIFAEMAENLKQVGGLAGSMNVIQRQLGDRDYIKKTRGTKAVEVKGTGTNEYKALEVLIDSNVYGIEKKDIRSGKLEKNAFTEFLGIDGKVFSASKFMSRLSGFIRTNNLALNPVTSTAGALKGAVDSILEDQIGLYTTMESKNWARAEYAKNIFEVLGQTMRKKQTNKMHLMLQRNNVVNLSSMLSNTTKSKLLQQATSKDLLFINYRTADYAIKGRVALAIYDNIRYVDGEYITRKQFREKRDASGMSIANQKIEWKAARAESLYNAYDVVDGQLVIKDSHKDKVTDAVENFAVGKVEHVSNMVDGTLSEADKGAIARTIYGDFVLMHRGWFINMIDSRVMPEVTNMISGEKEMGMYRASLKFIREDLIRNRGYKSPISTFKNLENPAQKRAIKRTALDLLYLNIISFIAAFANIMADEDDDDDFLTQYAAYQMNRILLEQSAPWNPSELLQMIDEPIVGVRTIKDLVDLSEAWNTDVYKGGMYKDSYHATKWWIRKTPFKSMYEAQYPGQKNNFIKQVVDSRWYNLLKEDDEHKANGMSWVRRLKLMFADEQSTSDAEALEIIEYMEAE